MKITMTKGEALGLAMVLKHTAETGIAMAVTVDRKRYTTNAEYSPVSPYSGTFWLTAVEIESEGFEKKTCVIR